MDDECCRVPQAGSPVSDWPAPGMARLSSVLGRCPACGELGKPVQDQPVKSLLAVSLRALPAGRYYF